MDKYGFVQEVKKEWKSLWNGKFYDQVTTESIALKDYSLLFVDRGTVVSTSKGSSIGEFEKIVRRHEVDLGERIISQPNPHEGGYRKFISEVIMPQSRYGRVRSDIDRTKPKRGGPLKKNGRGWLHQL